MTLGHQESLWSTYHIGIIKGFGTWPQFCVSFGPSGVPKTMHSKGTSSPGSLRGSRYLTIREDMVFFKP